MAKSSTTWEKGKRPPVQKPKGALNKRTLLKKQIGIDNWSQLEGWAENDGIKKAIQKLSSMRSGENYINNFVKILEYIKPKLSRTEYKDDTGDQIQFDFMSLPIELRTQLLEHLRNNGNTGNPK